MAPAVRRGAQGAPCHLNAKAQGLLNDFPTLSPDQIVDAIAYEARRAGRKKLKANGNV